MNLFLCEQINQPVSVLSKDESHHCVRVMRMREGDIIHLFDGRGTKATGTISLAHKKKVQVTIEEKIVKKPPQNTLHIAIAPTKKNDRTEWFLEKATELGVSEISLVVTQNSERRTVNEERFERIILTAAKQSMSDYIPTLHSLQSLNEFMEKQINASEKYIATLLEHNESNQLEKFRNGEGEQLILIGPEGGFTDEEVQTAVEQNFTPVSLGEKRLRTETAGVFAAMVGYMKINL